VITNLVRALQRYDYKHEGSVTDSEDVVQDERSRSSEEADQYKTVPLNLGFSDLLQSMCRLYGGARFGPEAEAARDESQIGRACHPADLGLVRASNAGDQPDYPRYPMICPDGYFRLEWRYQILYTGDL